jgi:hypothetical protein
MRRPNTVKIMVAAVKKQINKTRPIKSEAKRKRRGKAEIRELRDALFTLLESENPMTVRQVFYRMVGLGAIAKTEAEYKNTVCRLLSDLRRARVIPFGWIADNTRWMRKPDTYSELASALEYTARTYRRSVWDNQDAYVECWLEKDALAGVLMEETEKWDVPLMVTRGYSSISFLHSAGEAIQAEGKPAYLYYFGDYDPSGVDITRVVERGIREFAPDAEIHFERVAVTEEQIETWSLPTRPTKKSDSRSKNFEGESVEVDAIPPELLRQLVRERIEQHIDEDALERLKHNEALERETMERIADAWEAGKLAIVPDSE